MADRPTLARELTDGYYKHTDVTLSRSHCVLVEQGI